MAATGNMRKLVNIFNHGVVPELPERQSGRGHRDDRPKNISKNNQIFDHKMGSRGRFETFDI